MDALSRNSAPEKRRVAYVQGVYYVATGLWPILHMRSFEAVTGPKAEVWLVKMVGALAAAVGWTLLGAARACPVDTNIKRLGVLSALGFAVVDLWYGGVRRRISPIYLAEALPELALVVWWSSHQDPVAGT
jgi:hypothetical protein